MSDEDLDVTTARLYRGLVEQPGAEFTANPLAAGLEVPVTEVERVLGRLLEANLVTETGDERYRLYDLVRDHVTPLTDQDDEARAPRGTSSDDRVVPAAHRGGRQGHQPVPPSVQPRLL
ncbi:MULTISPECIES: hypothetical protein [Prauserella]|nr:MULTISPECIES: hypothetical protein [Prauserella]PXY18633.1 hypothetical protein BAY59_33710 [Prauserella coralliicola]TKG63566.1 hypothetical protein FCN18_30160 [Prauserella endophytica]